MAVVASPPSNFKRSPGRVVGHTADECLWLAGRRRRGICLFIARYKTARIRKSRVCWHGIAKKTKEKGAFDGSLPISQIDWHGNQRRVLSPRLMSGAVKSWILRSLHTLTHSHTPPWPAPCCLSSASPPLSRDFNRSARACMCE